MHIMERIVQVCAIRKHQSRIFDVEIHVHGSQEEVQRFEINEISASITEFAEGCDSLSTNVCAVSSLQKLRSAGTQN